jgi:hypothetical protein
MSLDHSLAPELLNGGLDFLDHFATRGLIIEHLIDFPDVEKKLVSGRRTRVDVAIILSERGKKAEAASLLREQVRITALRGNHGHIDYVKNLAIRLGLGDLDT